MSVSKAQIDQRLESGIRDLWYPICPSHFVKRRPIAVKRIGFNIVLWRDSAGKAYALEDRCPHRSAPLSLGTPADDRIACAYHGVEVNSQGVAVKVPGSPGCKLEGMRLTRAFPLAEAAGAVFLFIANTRNAEPRPFVVPEELTSPDYSHFLCYTEWAGDYRYVYDNVMDPMHGTYLHKQSHSMGFGDTAAKFQITDTDKGFIFEKIGQRNVNFDWTEFMDLNALWLKLEIPYPATGGPGGNFLILGIYTPISPTMTAVFHWRCRRLSGWQRDTWRFLYKNRLEERHWLVLEQDRVLIETMEPYATKREMLYEHDLGVARLRRYTSQKAEAQLAKDAIDNPQ